MQGKGSKTDEPTPLVRDAKENREKKMERFIEEKRQELKFKLEEARAKR